MRRFAMGDKTKEKGAEGQTEETIDPALLQKSWKESLDELRKSVNPDDEKLEKAKKPKVADLETEEEEGEEEDNVAEEEDEAGEEAEKGKKKPEKVKKSLPDLIAEDDPEAEAAMDIEPFLKSLAKQIGEKTTTLEDAVGSLAKMVRVQGKALLSSMEMQKSLQEQVAIIGGQPVPVKGVLQKSGGAQRFAPAAEGGEKPLDKQEVMLKAMDLQRQGKINSRTVTVLEGRLNHGQGIPEDIAPLFAPAEGGK
jgi:hypothetical protein